MKVNLTKEQWENKINLENGEIGAGNVNFSKENNMFVTVKEFEKRWGYCTDELDSYWKECSTSDFKDDEYCRKNWLEHAEKAEKVASQLKLCAIDARYISDFYKKKQ